MSALSTRCPGSPPTSLMRALRLIVVVALAAVVGQSAAMGSRQAAQKPAVTPDASPLEPEAMLVKTLIEVRNNRLEAALAEVEKVIQSYPNFRLAHLVKGDLLLARSRPLRELGEAPNAPRDRIEDLRDEARVRLARYNFERPADQVPKYLLQLNAEQKHVLIVDTRHSTLYVFENNNGVPRYLADYYVSSGKNGSDKTRQGDKKTPLGVYHVTDNLPRAKLGALYGVGAFPISYPNEMDRREEPQRQRRSGCTACRSILTAVRRARATAAWCSRTRTSNPSARTCASGSHPSSLPTASSGANRKRSTKCARISRQASKAGGATGKAARYRHLS